MCFQVSFALFCTILHVLFQEFFFFPGPKMSDEELVVPRRVRETVGPTHGLPASGSLDDAGKGGGRRARARVSDKRTSSFWAVVVSRAGLGDVTLNLSRQDADAATRDCEMHGVAQMSWELVPDQGILATITTT